MTQMLTPENIQGLSTAIDAVIKQCGDDPKYADLTTALTDTSDALNALDGKSESESKGDPANDPETFEGAQKAFTESKAGGSQ